ncbi:MAG: VCBS repeat-containing protein, partial [Planctomycetaceae bacterium]|nr:VCBS repeat-containing protein [Planctomycetaceae bacterium]
MRSVLTLGLLCLLVARGASAQELTQLKYNNPGLSVDLGVGLWAWPVPCDADGDGDYDLLVSCPDKPSNGVWLFENTTGDTAKEKFPVFQPARRLSGTVHYVMPSYVGDEVKVLSPGTEYRNFLTSGTEEKLKLPIDPKWYKPQGTQPKGPKTRHNQWRYADYDGDGKVDLIVGIEDWSYYGWDDAWDSSGEWQNGPLHGFVYLFRNTGSNDEPTYAEPQQVLADDEPVDTYGCPSPNFADFDGDGDLDLLCGEFLDGFTYFENVGSRSEPRYAAGRRLRQADGTPLTMDLQMIVPIAFDWDRDGDQDLIVGDEDGRVALIEHTGDLDRENRPQFLPPRYFQQVADTLKCGALATPVGYDWDGDGDQDLLSGNTAGYIEFFENLSGPGVETPSWAGPVRLQAGEKTYRMLAGRNGSIQGPAEAKWGYTTLSVADWDGDELPDLIVNGIWGKIEWLRNIGTRTEPKLAEPAPVEIAWNDAIPTKPAWTWWSPEGNQLVTQWRTTPLVTDWNNDGLVDLVMLDHEGYLALYPRAQVDQQTVLLPAQRVFRDENGPLQLNDGTAGRSGRRKLCLVDWDGDGRLDLLANSTSANFLQQVDPVDGMWTFADRGPIVKQNIQ